MRTVTTCAVLLLVALASPAPARIPAVKIVEVSVKPAESGGPCPVTLTFRASVLLDMKSKFTYEWKLSTGEPDRNHHGPVWADGENAVALTQEWPFGENTPAFHPYRGWVKLYVRSPAPVLSDPVPFTVDCGAPPPGR